MIRNLRFRWNFIQGTGRLSADGVRCGNGGLSSPPALGPFLGKVPRHRGQPLEASEEAIIGPMVLDFPIVPIEDRMKIISVDTPFARKRAAWKVPQSVRDALRPIE